VGERRLGSRYVLGEWLGGGAMGKVYKAQDTNDPQATLAAKLMRPEILGNQDLVSRFLQEARLLRSIDHKNVVRILDLVAEGESLGIIMEYVADGDLRRTVTVPAPVGLVTDIVGQVAEGLAAIHEAGITHRDLKPENILVERDAQGMLRPRVTDFGMSRHADSVPTGRTGIVGTTAYLAPETAAGALAGPASDVYALGVILLELCTGRRSPSAAGVASDPGQVAAAGSAVGALPEQVQTLLADMLAHRPEDRPSAARVAERCGRLRIPDEDPGIAPDAGAGRIVPGDAFGDEVDQAVGGGAEAPSPQGLRDDEVFGNQDTLTLIPMPSPAGAGPATTAGERDETPGAGTVHNGGASDEEGIHAEAEAEATSFLWADDQEPSATSETRTRAELRASAARTQVGAGSGQERRPRRQKRQWPAFGRPALIVALFLGVVLPSVLAMRSKVLDGAGAMTAPGTSSSAETMTPSDSSSGNPTVSASATETPQLPLTPFLEVYEPTSRPMKDFDRKAPLRISGVEAGSGDVASITVRYAGGSKKVTPKKGDSTYTVTVGGLTNGKTYTFSVRVCNTDELCATSASVTHMPYTAPTLQAPELVALDHEHMMFTWHALSQNGHPETWTCRISTESTLFDPWAPQDQEVSSSGGSLVWRPHPGSVYTVTEFCRYESLTVRASSAQVQAF
jgi:hypothetical protein